MNIGVVGPGNIGEVIIRKLRDQGYRVKMANAPRECPAVFQRPGRAEQIKRVVGARDHLYRTAVRWP
jgi:prephenate dehydrogenase